MDVSVCQDYPAHHAGDGVADFLAGDGEMQARMRAMAWEETPLGPCEDWPQSLKTAVRILLTSRFAMWLGWGEDLTFLYNNAYRPALGVKHPKALGATTRHVWHEIWPDIGPRIDRVLTSGEATWDEALLLFLERSGYPEETYHTFSYSPLADDRGDVVGVLCVVAEDTDRVISQRRMASLRGLSAEIARGKTRADVLLAAERQLGANPRDLPFCLVYLFQPDGTARLVCATGAAAGDPIAPARIDPADSGAAWPINRLMAERKSIALDDLGSRFQALPTGAWARMPHDAVIAPIGHQAHDTLAGFLVAGLNPHRALDEAYKGFIDLVAGQIETGIARADAYEDERKKAEALAEIDRAKTLFFTNVSHEFRTPLTLMLGPLQEVVASPVPAGREADRRLVEIAHRNALRLLKLVNSLLDFSGIEAGRADARLEPTELAGFTAELASSFRSMIEDAGLALRIDCPRLPRPVRVDRDMWEKIVLNLLSNAFKFTFQGHIAVSVRPSADGQAAELAVRDTGTGIPADELPRLFERFHRVAGARGRTFEGSGIGLALVQELVKLQGGAIAVDSTVGQGTTFRVSVPFAAGEMPTAGAAPTGVRARSYVEEARLWTPETAEPAPGGHDSAPRAVTGRVLVADDNADMRGYVVRLLTEEGYAVEAVADGDAALAAARRHRPDLVVSDVMMPGLDGIGLLRALRGDPALNDVPVLLLTARAGEESRVGGLTWGADDYLTKPFPARELLARIGANLKIARARRHAAEALRTRTMELEAVMETVPAAVWFTHDLDGSRVLGNRQSDILLRLETGAPILLSAPLDDRSPFRVYRDGAEASLDSLAIKRAVRGEEVHNDEIEIRFNDGRAVTLLTHGMPLRDATGTIRGAVAAGIDISGRKKQEERFRRVVEAAPSAMVMINGAGRIEMVNTQAERVFGYARSELLGQTVETLVPAGLRARHPELRQSFGANPRTRPMGAGRDLYALRKDGSEFPVEIGLNPIDTEDGPMVLSAIVDISDRKQKEKRIQAALNEKDALLGEIHHRVKNNLQIVYSLLGLQSARLTDPAVLDMLRDSQNRIRSMALIHQTLYQSKDFAEIDFGHFLDTLVPTLIASYGLNPNNIAFTIVSDRVLLPIDAAIPCGLVVNELISNALRHAFPAGRGGKIDVTLGHEPDGLVALCVSDDGVGVPDHIGLAETATLGLQLVSLLAEQLGGTVDMRRSGPTRFLVRFPIDKFRRGSK